MVPHVFEHAESENDYDFDQKFREPFGIRYIQNNPNIPVHFYTKSLNQNMQMDFKVKKLIFGMSSYFIKAHQSLYMKNPQYI